jgi:hypothetical protein
MKGLTGLGPTSGVLQAWWAGEEVTPGELHRALDIEARLNCETAMSRELIELALNRLETHFQQEVFQ